jgi:transcriptional regulator with XRE-family HTH domain
VVVAAETERAAVAAGRRGGVAALVVAARRRAGLSQRDLAARTGLSPATVAAIEAGEDPRGSTLRALRRALPWLGAGRLLSDEGWVPAGPCEGAWSRYRDACGFTVGLLAHRIVRADDGTHRLRLEFEDVRPRRASLVDPRARHALLLAVFRGPVGLLAEALAAGRDRPGEVLALEHAGARHEIRLPERFEDGGLDVACERIVAAPPDPAGGTSRFALGLPVEQLTLAVDFGGAGSVPEQARYVAHAVALGGDTSAGAAPVLGELAVQARTRREDGTWSVDVRRPLAHVVHELAWGAPSEAHAPPLAAEPAEAVRLAREEAGMSARAVAGRMSTSATVVRATERGVDTRRSTLRSLLRVLPSLRPEALVPPASGEAFGLTDAELWAHGHELCGVAADAEAKLVTIAEDGWAQVTYRTSGLRALGATLNGLAVRYGASRPPDRPAAPPDEIACEGGDEDDESFRTRLRRGPDGLTVHDLAFSAAALQRGVSYRRVMHHAFRAVLPGASEGDVHGVGLSSTFPTRRLRLSIRFPAGRWPRAFRTCVTPLALPPDLADAVTEASRLGPAPVMRVDARAHRVRLSVCEPLLGVRYGIGWLA